MAAIIANTTHPIIGLSISSHTVSRGRSQYLSDFYGCGRFWGSLFRGVACKMNDNAIDTPQPPQPGKKMKIVAWYENKSSVFIALLFFWPLGIYALAKNTAIKKGWKVVLNFLFGGWFFASLVFWVAIGSLI